MEDEERNMAEVLGLYMEQNKIYHLEGDSGCEKMEQILSAIGYPGHSFRWGSPIESFLSDNPGAMSALIEWIEEQEQEEWIENLESELEENEDDEEEEG